MEKEKIHLQLNLFTKLFPSRRGFPLSKSWFHRVAPASLSPDVSISNFCSKPPLRPSACSSGRLCAPSATRVSPRTVPGCCQATCAARDPPRTATAYCRRSFNAPGCQADRPPPSHRPRRTTRTAGRRRIAPPL